MTQTGYFGNIVRTFFVMTLLCACTTCICAQSRVLDSIAEKLLAGQLTEALRQLNRHTTDSIICQSPEFHYYFGVAEELAGNTDKAHSHYLECMNLSEDADSIGESYVDAAARSINHLVDNEDWLQVVRLSRRALTAPDSILLAYPNTFHIYDWYVGALNALWKYEKVPLIAKEGQKYAETKYLPTDKAFYNMRLAEIMALLMMNRWEEADACIEEMDSVSRTSGNNVMAAEVYDLRDNIAAMRDRVDWRAESDLMLYDTFETAKSLLLESPASEAGSAKWRKFFEIIISQLELYYFDINNPDDEKYWNQLLAYAIVYFNIIGDYLPERAKLAYDLILLTKNFLDYNSGLLHKSPKRWQDVRDGLAPGELAIEITMCPDEILLLSRDFKAPVAIPIPESIVGQIEKYNSNDATVINDFYSERSPLCGLIDLLTPYLSGIKTIYLSPTNLFAQFNYSSIPYLDGRLDDKFRIIQMTTTADIPHLKNINTTIQTERAFLFGGIDYGPLPDKTTSAADRHSDVTGTIADLRSGFGYLPHTLREVETIAAMIPGSSLFVGSDASERTFKSIDWSRTHAIIHIATHGYTLPTPDIEELTDTISQITSIRSRSGLMMAGANVALRDMSPRGQSIAENDGILTSQEIADLDLGNIDLVVLSSCSSGMGDLTNTTGIVYGVTNAMKSAGVKHILATLWDIPDEASAIAMSCFYRHLISGADVHTALKAMRQDMIDQGFHSPYYWASFVCME